MHIVKSLAFTLLASNVLCQEEVGQQIGSVFGVITSAVVNAGTDISKGGSSLIQGIQTGLNGPTPVSGSSTQTSPTSTTSSSSSSSSSTTNNSNSSNSSNNNSSSRSSSNQSNSSASNNNNLFAYSLSVALAFAAVNNM